MTRDHYATPSSPTRDCREVESLLPVLDEPALDAAAVARARAHVAGCAYCQDQFALYARLEAELRREPRDLPRHTTEEIMSQIETEHAADEAVTPAYPPRPAATWDGGRQWTRASRIASVAAVLVVAVLLAGLLARHQLMGSGPGTRPSPRAHGDIFANTQLHDLAMVSPTEGWAVGESEHPSTGDGVTYAAMVLHLRNGNWTRTDLPYHTRLTSISMLSPTEGWAAGDNIMLHFDGQHWTPSPLPDNWSFATQVQEISPTVAWAVDGSPAGVLHYDGHTWQYQPLPASLLNLSANQSLSLNQLRMVSANEGWAVGTLSEVVPGATDASGSQVSSPTGVILHYQAGVWSLETRLPNTSLQTLTLAPAGTVLAAGYTVIELHPAWTTPEAVYPSDRPIVLARTNGIWQRDDAPIRASGVDPASIQQADFVSSSDAWLTAGMDGTTNEQRLLHLTAGGWSRVALPSVAGIRELLIARVVTMSPSESWAVGNTISCQKPLTPTLCTSRTLILHQVNGTWVVVS